MKNLILSALAILYVSFASAQVYVGDGFIYSKGTDLYAKGNINISTDGKLYLRGEAQLIQGDNVPNEGEGELSIFQEGNANNYTYNYWSSPVGQATASDGNLGFLNSQINFPRLQANFTETGYQSGVVPEADLRTNFVIDSEASTILAVGVRDGLTDEQTSASSTQPLRIAGRWLYTYNNGGGAYSGWVAANSSATNIATGYGFSMKGVSGAGPNVTATGQRYDFRGRPNNGDIPVDVNTDDFSLVGNPYPSALDLKQFLIDANYDSTAPSGSEMRNAEIDNAILFWEQYSTSHQLTDYEGGYGTYVPGAVTNATLDANGNYIGVDNGMYAVPTFTRFDANGNITNGTVSGGPVTPTGAAVTRRYAPIGQGFIISRTENTATSTAGVDAFFAAGTNGAVLFRNRQRSFVREDGDLSIFKNASANNNATPQSVNDVFVRPKLKLNIKIDDLYVRQLTLAFGEDSTDNLDWGLEGKIDGNKQITDVYMPQYGGEYVIKTIPFLDTKRVELGFEAAADNTTLEFHVGVFENFDTPNVFIYDKHNNTYHDVKNGAFNVTVNTGTINDRFEIVFRDSDTLSNEDTVVTEEQFDVVQNNNDQLLTVFNPNGLEVSNISLFDLAGREVISSLENSSNNAYSFETADLSTGIYVVRILTADQQEAAVKVSINN